MNNEECPATSIITHLGAGTRISSIYRRFSNSFFEMWGWETLLFEDGEQVKQYDVLDSADDVVNLHAEIAKEVV